MVRVSRYIMFWYFFYLLVWIICIVLIFKWTIPGQNVIYWYWVSEYRFASCTCHLGLRFNLQQVLLFLFYFLLNIEILLWKGIKACCLFHQVPQRLYPSIFYKHAKRYVYNFSYIIFYSALTYYAAPTSNWFGLILINLCRISFSY